MNNEEIVNYFIIDSKNSFSFNTSSVNEIKDIIKAIETHKEALANSQNKINDIVAKLLNSNNVPIHKSKPKTSFNLSTSISLFYIKKEKEYLKALSTSMNSILNNSFTSNEFAFNDDIVNDISIALMYSFYKIYSLSKQFRIYSQSDYEKTIAAVRHMNFEVIHSFANKNADGEMTYMSNDSQSEYLKNKSKMNSSNSTEAESNYSFIQGQHDIKYYSFKHDDEEKYALPKVLIALLNKFCIIKRINISIDDIKDDMIYQWLIILLNVQFLLPNLLEVNYSLVSNKITTLVNSTYDNEIIRKQNEDIESVSSSISSSIEFNGQYNEGSNRQEKNGEKHEGYIHQSLSRLKEKGKQLIKTIIQLPRQGREFFLRQQDIISTNNEPQTNNDQLIDLDIVKQIELKLNMIIIISHYISQWERIRVLKLVFNDSFDKETEIALRQEQWQESISQDYCCFLNHFLFAKNIIKLTICFNSLDSASFKSIISLILNCTKIRQLSLQLFSNEDVYNCVALFKLCNRLSIDTSELFHNNQSVLEVNNLSDDLSHSMIDKMLHGFSLSLSYLFNAIKSLSSSLSDLDLNINLPSIIEDNDLYTTVLIKFILNIFIFIINGKHLLNSVKISASQLSFNDRKCPLINQFLESIDYNNNAFLTKHTNIQRLTIKLRFLSVVNISKMVMTNLRRVNIGDLDPETFKAFAKYYSSNEYISSSQLTQLSISMSVAIFDLSVIKNDLMLLYRSHPCNLLELLLYSNITMTKDELMTIFNIINYNSVEKYGFNSSKNQEEIINNDKDVIKSIQHLYYTHNIIRSKIRYAYKRLRIRFALNNANNNKELFKPLHILRDYLSEKKTIQFAYKC